MSKTTAIASAQAAALARPGTTALVQSAHDIYLANCRNVAGQVDAGVQSAARGIELRQMLDRSHLQFLQNLLDASDEELHLLLHPEDRPEAKARAAAEAIDGALDIAASLGVRLIAVPGGGLEASPASRITPHLGTLLDQHAGRIWTRLRTDIRTWDTRAA